MKQSNNKKSRDVTAFLYERLSRDDNLEGESYSIGNQKKLLTKVAKEKGYTNLVHFMDDGISGVTMDRPGFVDMIHQLEEGRAAAVFVKDLSRLGRNYIEVGRLTEEFFPEHDIRLVAVSDNIDTAEGENEMAPIRNLFNEWYARDISKKRRISNKIKGNAGEPMGQPPYGYMKDPDNPKRWIVDDEAALVVKRIYSMTLDGLGTEQIAAQLERYGEYLPLAPIGYRRALNAPERASSYRLQGGTARPSPKFFRFKNTAAISSISRPTLNLIRTRNGLIMTVRIGSFSRTYTNRSLIVPCGSRCSRNEEQGADGGRAMERKICFRVFWFVPTAETTSITISIKAIPRSSISTVTTTRATEGLVPLPIMSVWIFWSRWCLAKSNG